jgi:MinD-like ATPase involved in chromosome partitioning or flagellar assembly
MSKMIFVLGSKGGIGKSFIAREITCRLSDSFLLDTDNVNGIQVNWFNDSSKCKLLDENRELSITDEQKEKLAKHIIVDTKGGYDDFRLQKIIPKGDIFIVAVTPNKGAFKGLVNTISKLDETLNGESGKKSVIIVVNDIESEKDMTKETKEFNKILLDKTLEIMDNVKNIDVIVRTKVESHKVVKKSENIKKGIKQLQKEYMDSYNKKYYVQIDKDLDKLVKLIKEL